MAVRNPCWLASIWRWLGIYPLFCCLTHPMTQRADSAKLVINHLRITYLIRAGRAFERGRSHGNEEEAAPHLHPRRDLADQLRRVRRALRPQQAAPQRRPHLQHIQAGRRMAGRRAAADRPRQLDPTRRAARQGRGCRSPGLGHPQGVRRRVDREADDPDRAPVGSEDGP